jgi:riboflavin kinase/FMN adenylyltransferase
MRRHKGYRGLAPIDRGAAVAIGNFDGVHLGHRSLLALAQAEAGRLGAPFGVVTFSPHPRRFFQPDAPPFRLQDDDGRARRLAQLGVEQLYELPFDAELAGLSAEAFLSEVLVGALGVRHLAAGGDFHFGKGRRGNCAMAAQIGPALGLGVSVAPLLAVEGQEVSSTAIRAALAEGRTEAAARMLGDWHRIEGPVLHGDARGRDLGFPTANLSLGELHRPRYGVYAALVDVLDGPHAGRWMGAASLGERPTFGRNAPNFEAHLLDFSGDLYGATISVALVAWLRPEVRFEGIGPLVAQMERDVAEARALLAGVGA